MKNREVLVALRKLTGNKKIMQRDVESWGTEALVAKKGQQVAELPALGVWVVYKLPTL